MHIKSLLFKNYRCYEDLQIEFNQNYSILVGVNGVGKSAILDAISTVLGSYIAGFDGIATNGIYHDDAHRKMFELGSRIEAEEQYPVEIAASANVGGNIVEWKRSLHAKNGRTHINEAKSIMAYSKKLQNCVREGDKKTILPLIAYYGTGRLYMQKRQKKNVSVSSIFSRTAGYIDCLDSASNDKQMMSLLELYVGM